MCGLWQWSMGESYEKKTERPLTGLDFPERPLKYRGEQDPGSFFLWQQHLFLLLLYPLSVLQQPLSSCWAGARHSSAPGWAGAGGVGFDVPARRARYNPHWQLCSVLWNLNSWRSIWWGGIICTMVCPEPKSHPGLCFHSWSESCWWNWGLETRVLSHSVPQSIFLKYSLKKELSSGAHVVYRLNSMLKLIFIATMNLLEENGL